MLAPGTPGIALSPEGASFPRGFPYICASAPTEGRVHTNKVSAHMMVILHTCVCGVRLHVTTLLEVWPSPVPRDTDALSLLCGCGCRPQGPGGNRGSIYFCELL